MPAQRIEIIDDTHWRELRARHVGGSEVATLFGESAHTTAFELWHQKKGLLPLPDLSDNARVFWGSCLEPSVANGVAAMTGWDVLKVGDYYSALPGLALGGSLDYWIAGQDRGPGVLEIKTADWLVAKRWKGNEPPLSYMLQIQSYLALTKWSWGCIAVLVGGNDLRLFEFDRRPKTISLIEKRVSDFWRSIHDNIPPKPDFDLDGDAISKIYSTVQEDKVIDLTGSNRLPALIEQYNIASQQKRQEEHDFRAAKAEIFSILEDAEIAVCGDFTIKSGMVKGIPCRVIDESMIGLNIPGREGHRGLWISRRKEEKV